MNSGKSAPYSIARRLTRRLFLAAGVVLVLAGFALDILVRHELAADLDRALLAKARALSALTQQDEDDVEFSFELPLMPEFAADQRNEFFELWIDTSTPSARSPSMQQAHFARMVPWQPAAPRYATIALPDGRTARRIQLDFQPPLDPEEHLDPKAITRPMASVVVARDFGAITRLLTTLRWIYAGLGATVLGSFMWLARRTVRQDLQPLDALRAQLAGLDVHALNARVEAAVPTQELQPVFEQLNALLARLDLAFNRERQFSAAAAHELRTPLAEIRSLAEVGARYPEDRQLAQNYFNEIVAAVDQLARLTDNLLALARRDSDAPRAALGELVYPLEIVEQQWQRLTLTATSRRTTLACTTPGFAIVGGREELELIIGNLLTNAVVHSPPGAQIRVSLRRLNQRFELCVSNPNGSLTQADLVHVFDRFWRKDESRTGGTHAGLGLSLVQAYATALGFSVRVALTEEGRVEFTLNGDLA